MSSSLEKPANYDSGLGREAFAEADAMVAHLKSSDATAVERSIQFLERDEYIYGTGYVKEKLWRRLRHVTLTETHKARLRKVALLYVQRRLTREFFPMCRFISFIGCEEPLRKKLVQLEGHGDAMTWRRAALLLAYCESVPNGENTRWGWYDRGLHERQEAWRKLRKASRRKFR